MTDPFVSVKIKTQYPAIERQLEAIKRRLKVPNSPTPAEVDLDVDLSFPSYTKAPPSMSTSISSSLISLDRNTSLSKNSILRVSLKHSDADRSTASEELGEHTRKFRLWDDPNIDKREEDPSKLEREFIILLAKSKTDRQMSKFRRSKNIRDVF